MRKRIIRYTVQAFRFRRWSRKRYAAFVSRQRACTMGTLHRNVVDRLLRKSAGPVGPAVARMAVVMSGDPDSPVLAGWPGISDVSDRPGVPEACLLAEAGFFFPAVVCAGEAASAFFGATRSGEIRSKVSGGPASVCRVDNRFIYFSDIRDSSCRLYGRKASGSGTGAFRLFVCFPDTGVFRNPAAGNRLPGRLRSPAFSPAESRTGIAGPSAIRRSSNPTPAGRSAVSCSDRLKK